MEEAPPAAPGGPVEELRRGGASGGVVSETGMYEIVEIGPVAEGLGVQGAVDAAGDG